MQFTWSSDERRFRDRVVEFLKADLLVPHWPVEYGGGGGSGWQHLILGEEMWAAGEPRGPQYMNVNWIGPTLMRHGTGAQKERYLKEAAAGTVIWCQGFSEPSAGSDLFSLRTSARREGETFVINGSKIWTSYAALADHCFLLARTSGRRKEGVCIFLIDMKLPGITVRPIPSLVGEGDIHEVFLNDVVVPADSLLGEEGQAADIIKFSLGNERVGIARYEMARRTLNSAVTQIKELDLWRDEHIAYRAGQALAACEAARLLVYKVADQKAREAPQGADASLARIAVVGADHAVANFALEFLPQSFSTGDNPDLTRHHERAIVTGIASGAAEVQLDIIASSHLELPRV